MAQLWHVGTFISTLTRTNEKLARGHVDHAGTPWPVWHLRGHYFGRVEVYGGLFWVSGTSFGVVGCGWGCGGVGGCDWGRVHCLIMLKRNNR